MSSDEYISSSSGEDSDNELIKKEADMSILDISDDDEEDDEEDFDNMRTLLLPEVNSDEAKTLNKVLMEVPRICTQAQVTDAKTGKILAGPRNLSGGIDLDFISHKNGEGGGENNTNESGIMISFLNTLPKADLNTYNKYKMEIQTIITLHEKVKLLQYSFQISSILNTGSYCTNICKKCIKIIHRVEELMPNYYEKEQGVVVREALMIYYLTIANSGRVRTPDSQLKFCPIVAALAHKIPILSNIREYLNTEIIQFISGLPESWYSHVVPRFNDLYLYTNTRFSELDSSQMCLLEVITNSFFSNRRSLEIRPDNFVTATIALIKFFARIKAIQNRGTKVKKYLSSEKVKRIRKKARQLNTRARTDITDVITGTRGVNITKLDNDNTKWDDADTEDLRKVKNVVSGILSSGQGPLENKEYSKTARSLAAYVREYALFTKLSNSTLSLMCNISLNRPLNNHSKDNKCIAVALKSFHMIQSDFSTM